MQLDTKVKITIYTISVKTTFKVKDNGAKVIHNDCSDGIYFNQDPYIVSFETSE